MKLSTPKNITFWIAVILAVLGVIFLLIPAVSSYAVLLALLGFVVLALGNLLKGW